MRQIVLNHRLLRVLFILISLILLILIFKTYRMFTQISRSAESIAIHTEHRFIINRTYSAFVDVETSTRGFLHTGDKLFLQSIDLGLNRFKERREKLAEMEYFSPLLSEYKIKLLRIFNDRLLEIEKIYYSTDTTGTTIFVQSSAEVMEEIRGIVDKMNERENRLIDLYTADLKSYLYSAPSTVAGLAVVFLAFLVFAYLSLLEQFKITSKSLKELSETNKSLNESQAFLKSILESNPNNIIAYTAVRDKDLTITNFKVAFAANIDRKFKEFYNPEQIIGMTINELFPSVVNTPFYNYLLEVTTTGENRSFEYYYPDDGHIGGWYEVHFAKFGDGVIVNGRNIDMIKQAEIEIKKSIEEVEARNLELDEQKKFAYMVFNSLPVSLTVLDKDFKISFANTDFYKQTSITLDVVGMDYKQLFGMLPETEIKVMRGEELRLKEYYHPQTDHYYDIHVIPVKNHLDEYDGMIIVSANIDEQINARNQINNYIQELRQSNDQLKQFNFITSHDLQEPLRKIQTFANRIHDKPDSKTLQHDITKMKNAAARMSELIESFGRFSQFQIKDTEFQLVDLNKVMEQALQDLKKVITEKRAEIVVDELPTIKCDPDQINQLFFHLISNSLKFTRNKPFVKITCSNVSNPVSEQLNGSRTFYRITFQDRGIGFSNEHSDKMFMIFQKLHNTKDFAGTGIGLSICRKIVQNHKGSISAFSTELKGSTFDVYLPVDPE